MDANTPMTAIKGPTMNPAIIPMKKGRLVSMKSPKVEGGLCIMVIKDKSDPPLIIAITSAPTITHNIHHNHKMKPFLNAKPQPTILISQKSSGLILL